MRILSLRIKNFCTFFVSGISEKVSRFTFSFVYSTVTRSSDLLRKLYSEVMNPICNNCEMLVIALVLIFHSTSSTTALTPEYFRFFHAFEWFPVNAHQKQAHSSVLSPKFGANLCIWSDYQSSKLIKDAPVNCRARWALQWPSVVKIGNSSRWNDSWLALLIVRRKSERNFNWNQLSLIRFSMRLSLKFHNFSKQKHFHSMGINCDSPPKVIETRDQSARWWNKEF